MLTRPEPQNPWRTHAWVVASCLVVYAYATYIIWRTL